jgi:hypothetical protein
MRGMHDLTQQAILNQEKELQVEYADIDDQYVSPKIEYLQNKLNNLTQEVAKGYNPAIADELVQTRREYLRETGPKGTIGRAQSNYKAMQQALSDYDKAHPKDPEWFREAAKKNIIANYKGMQDEAGNFVEFTSGRATGYRDVGEDAIEYLKNAGASDQDLNLVREGKLKITPIKDAYGNAYMQVEQLVPGNYRSNVQNLEAGLNQLQSEWLNPETDRGLSGQLAGYTPEYITGTLSNIGNMLTKQVMSDQPRWSGSLQKVDKPENSNINNDPFGKGFTPIPYTGVTGDSAQQKKINKDFENLNQAFNQDNFDINTLSDDNVADNVLKFITEDLPTGELLNYVPPVLMAKGYNHLYKKWISGNKKEKTEALWETYKEKYNNYYTTTRDPNTTFIVGDEEYKGDKAFLMMVKAQEQAKAAHKTTEYNLAIDKPIATLQSKIIDREGDTWRDNKGNYINKSQLSQKISDSGIPEDNFPMMIDSEGNPYIELYSGNKKKVERYTLNPEKLPRDIKTQWDAAKTFEDELTRMNLSKEEIESLNSNNLTISQKQDPKTGIIYSEEIDVTIDPNNPISRDFKIITTYYDPNNLDASGKPIKYMLPQTRPLDFSELYAKGLQGIFTGVTYKNKIKK